jgi:hypothetical protein
VSHFCIVRAATPQWAMTPVICVHHPSMSDHVPAGGVGKLSIQAFPTARSVVSAGNQSI